MTNDNIVILDQIIVDQLNIMMVRDDLYPFYYGGSKARKAVAYEQMLRQDGYNAIVTCGGVQSNHNRAMALMCARNGWRCHLCVQDTDSRFFKEKGNAQLCRDAGAEVEIIAPQDTAAAMDNAMERLKQEGFNPYYVIGGGHNLPGGTCFVDAVGELKRLCDNINYKPDYIFHASGTGSTQAGIAVGLDLAGWSDVKLVGISVARQQQRGEQVIIDYANRLAAHYGLDKDYTGHITFITDFLCGGYEQYTPAMKQYIDRVIGETSIIFDTTYSGKGFYGMMQTVAARGLGNKKLLFWHTGGLLNRLK
ncbi:MAG: pyridoxal-phosphate dependent enzyme [Bacteroidales bacterium]|nr:pyridoxal-phosphate dependent enzyme [Candidatus Sodaliphilus aphodohippi]